MPSSICLILSSAREGAFVETLNRPERRNAFDDALIHDLTAAFHRLGADDSVRALVLTGAGAAFSAGGDLNWMRRMAGQGAAENYADAMRLATMFRTLNELPKPTVARVNGAAFAGGVGLICCCDIGGGVRGRGLFHFRGSARPRAIDDRALCRRRDRRARRAALLPHRREFRRRGRAAHRARP